MTIDTRDNIDRCYNLINEITEVWVRDYFEIEEDEEIDLYWIGNHIGGVFEFSDMFITFENILDCYKHDIDKEKFHEWYWWCLENQKENISLAKFIISPKDKLKAEKEHLKDLKNRVKIAKETLEKALE